MGFELEGSKALSSNAHGCLHVVLVLTRVEILVWQLDSAGVLQRSEGLFVDR